MVLYVINHVNNFATKIHIFWYFSLSVRHISDVKQVTPLEHTVQLIPETAGMGCKCTLTINPDRITDLQWQAMDRTLPDNLAEITGKASKISEIISTWL